jgi:exopolyphosphatase/pppGpp-phosphohydrolase
MKGRLVRFIARETAAFVTQIRRRGFKRVIGTSGTIQALGALAIGATSALKLEDSPRVAVPAAGDLEP